MVNWQAALPTRELIYYELIKKSILDSGQKTRERGGKWLIPRTSLLVPGSSDESGDEGKGKGSVIGGEGAGDSLT